MLSFAVCGLILGISGKKLYEWYRNVLSGFTDPETEIRLHEHDTIDRALIDKKTGKGKRIPVPILKQENFGRNMCIDDKNIGGELYTILSNKDTGKIAAMMMTAKAHIICEILRKIPVKILMSVETVSKDLAESYDWVARTVFMNAIKIADKFHVIKLGFEALQAIRICYRQAVLTEEREEKEAWKKMGKNVKKFPKVKVFENGETRKELLARSRYLLFKFEREWSESQEERAKILFREFPEIKESYEIICAFRNFYECGIGKKDQAVLLLNTWYEKAKVSKREELKNFIHTIKNHEGEILMYFDEGHTNAFAESLNGKIQAFVRSNFGIRERNFFHFRIQKYFS